MRTNTELNLASDFVEKTDRSLFLTGKAGTGKTTFLHSIKANSLKRLIVVAPTGVAAINAKGVTIHSFFQMPFGPIFPQIAQSASTKANFQRKFSKTKIDIIRSLDLLIIDEISMVRADLLDGIDQVLRRYKNRDKVFGGVQVVMIGDLQQLSPVVKDSEWELLKPHYKTPYFFSSTAFEQCNAISIELKHIYRQDNEQFIKILNEIRNNELSQKSADALHKRYLPNFNPTKNDGYITLTTHNYRANEMNLLELKKINKKSFFYTADVEGKFPEYSFPTHQELELKVGAQVMFVKNDSSPEKRYFNGKIGKIIRLNEDEITVRCPDDDVDIIATPEIWENVNYAIDQESKEITENTVGSFSQIPLRLAWAITIHKSQGLTFEKAIIDVKAAFAHGQTYVALSRCRILDGIVLKSVLSTHSIISDTRVTAFNKIVEDTLPDGTILRESQKIYQLNLISDLFNYYAFLYPVNRLIDIYYTNKSSLKGTIIEPLTILKEDGIIKLLQISKRFNSQITALSTTIVFPETDAIVKERLGKAIAYFIQRTEDYIKRPLDKLTFLTDNKAVEKDFKKQLKLIEERLRIKLFCLDGLKEGFSTAHYLELRAKAVLQKSEFSVVKKVATVTGHPLLFSELRDLRAHFTEHENVHHYQIFTQKSLYEMCKFLPTTTKQLRAINGMGKIRVKKYGDEILEIIRSYCEKHTIKPKKEILEKEKPKKEKTQQISFNMFKDGMSIDAIADERGFVKSTIEGHLLKFMDTGEIKITDIMPEEKYLELKKIMEELKFEGLSDLKNKIGPKFTYSELRMVQMSLAK